jgi:hypothetical protein
VTSIGLLSSSGGDGTRTPGFMVHNQIVYIKVAMSAFEDE